MLSGCHFRVERWAGVSVPVRETLRGLLEGLGEFLSHILCVWELVFLGASGMLRGQWCPWNFPGGPEQPLRAQLRSTKTTSLGIVTQVQRKRITISGLGMAIRDFRPRLGLLSPRPLPGSLECIFSLLLSSCFSTSHLNMPPSFYVCCRSSCF